MTGPVPRIRIGLWLAALTLTCIAAEAAAGEVVSRLAEWSDTLPIDPRVIVEIDRYERDEDSPFGDAYAVGLATGVRRLVFESVRKALERPVERGHEPLIEVTFMEAGFAGRALQATASGPEAEFEKSTVRTECVAFLESRDITPAEALEIYADPAFRMETRSKIKRIWMDDGLDCVETDGVRIVMSPTLYCSRVDEFHDSTMAAQHSQAVSSKGGDGYQAVYFKESLKTFVKVPGGIVFHYINFYRGGGLGGVQKRVGKGKIVESEKRVIEEFAKRISPDAPPTE
jgi:hypothetical protein